jgi:hypothetical protein
MALIDFAILSGLVEELEVTKQLCSGMEEVCDIIGNGEEALWRVGIDRRALRS